MPLDYVKSALDAGLAEIGFSDHAPLPPPLRNGITMVPGQTEQYIDLIENVRRAFSDDIAVKLGFEVDFPFHDSFDAKYLSDPRLDYLIGSCHFIGGWAFDHPDNISEFDRRDIDEVYRQYYRIIDDMTGAGCFNILGHFDLVKKFGHRAVANLSALMEPLCGRIAKSGIAVEINTSGLRKPVGEIYPSREIIDLFFRTNVPVTLGSDSHRPDEVAYRFDLALGMLKNAGYRKIAGFSKRKRYDIVL